MIVNSQRRYLRGRKQQRLHIVTEITGRKRERVFAYRAYLEILNEGAQPL